jgi:hypothetical protein
MGNPIDFPPREPNPNRPAGVTAAGVVCILGSVLLLVTAAGMIAMSFGPAPTPPPGMTAPPGDFGRLMAGAGLLFGIFAAMGISTGVGLFKLRPWARVSILVFAGVMVAICVGAAVMLYSIPFPIQPAGNQAIPMDRIRSVALVVYAVPSLIGIWWLVQFNRAATKAAFGEGGGALPALGGPAGRPLSVTIIGVWLVVSGALTIVPALSGMPALVFGAVLTGWSAALAYAVIAAVQISAGSGLLKLHETARLLSIAWFVLGVANLAVMSWVPSLHDTVEAYQRTTGAMPPGQPPFDIVTFMQRMTVLWVIGAAVPIWFLVRRRSAFHGQHTP